MLKLNQITIIGVGHIGGSIGLALKEKEFKGKIVGVGRTEKNLNIAKKRGCIDEIDSKNLIKTADSDLIVLCTPVKSFGFWFKKIKKILKRDMLITDAGSVKEVPISEARKAGIGDNYVPAHPIAGKETSGAISADGDLFRDRVCIITPFSRRSNPFVKRAERFWKFIGCKVITMSPSMHDVLLAYTSHLPHLLAYAMTGLIGRQYDGENIIFGGGLRDFTRIAGSSPEMWHDIFFENKNNILKSIKDVEKEIKRIESYIKHEDSKQLFYYLQRSKNFRNKLIVNNGSTKSK